MTAAGAFAIARRLWPLAAVLAVLAALYFWGNHREGEGRDAERVEWETETARLRAVAVDEAIKRQTAVNNADTAARAVTTALDALAAATTSDRDQYYASNPTSVRACLDDSRLRAIAESDRRALAAAGATE